MSLGYSNDNIPYIEPWMGWPEWEPATKVPAAKAR